MQDALEAVRQQETDAADKLALTMEDSAAIFGILSRLYLEEPHADFIEALREMRFPIASGNDYIDKGYRGIATYLSKVGEAAQEDLAIDYSRTFIGNGIDSYSAAYPLESVHAGRKRLVMQDSRDEVLAIYRAYGLEMSGHLHEGEDHIACELEFMQFLASLNARELRKGNEENAENLAKAQANFLEDHLLNWVPKLTAQMRHFSKTEFYHGVSYLTFGFLKENKAMLEETLA